MRQAELDSLLPNSVSVIVRSSTPEPGQSCDEVFFPHNHPLPHTPTAHDIPEDRSLPLRHLLNSLNPQNQSDCHPPPHQGDRGAVTLHPPVPGLLSLSAPQAPWTPPRQRTSCLRNPNYPIHHILNSPRSSSLLAPLFVNSSETVEQVIMEMQQAKEDCDAKIRKFNRLIRRYDPGPLEPDAVQQNRAEWSRELSSALDDLVDSIETMSIKHGQDLGSQEVAVWKTKIRNGEEEFSNFTNKGAFRRRP